jgi:hypothetical protein
MSKNSPLNQIISNIQSNKPRVLAKTQTFLPPTTNLAHQTPEVPISPLDQKVTYPSGEKSTQDSQITGDKINAQDQNHSEDRKQSTDTNQPVVDPETLGTKVRLTREGKTAATLEKLKKGYTRVPNSILMEIIYGGLSKAEIKILLLEILAYCSGIQ